MSYTREEIIKKARHARENDFETLGALAQEQMFGTTDEGYCVVCAEGCGSSVEADAAFYTCKVCENASVFGAPELILFG